MQIKRTRYYFVAITKAKSRTQVLSVGVDLGRKRRCDVHCWWWERNLASALQKGSMAGWLKAEDVRASPQGSYAGHRPQKKGSKGTDTRELPAALFFRARS